MSDRAIAWSDQELYALRRLDEPPSGGRRPDVRAAEEEDQRDPRIFAKRRVRYHLKKGDLPEVLERLGLSLVDVGLTTPVGRA